VASLTLEFGVAGCVAPGHAISGDLEVVHYYDGGGGALVAVIDGIGHGEEAAATARLAADTLLANPKEPPALLLSHCHAALRGTRGVVLSVASIDLQRALVSWLGVGNVSGVVSRGRTSVLSAQEELMVRPGVLGSGELPPLRATTLPLRFRDTLILATDGISRHFADELPLGLAAQVLADDIIARHCPRNDDALVVVARAS
jgi:negative regulator of sigma-B (phosphoserine phosphatase)